VADAKQKRPATFWVGGLGLNQERSAMSSSSLSSLSPPPQPVGTTPDVGQAQFAHDDGVGQERVVGQADHGSIVAGLWWTVKGIVVSSRLAQQNCSAFATRGCWKVVRELLKLRLTFTPGPTRQDSS
jgi:hypothetical protein